MKKSQFCVQERTLKRYPLFAHTYGFPNISDSCAFAALSDFLMPKLGFFTPWQYSQDLSPPSRCYFHEMCWNCMSLRWPIPLSYQLELAKKSQLLKKNSCDGMHSVSFGSQAPSLHWQERRSSPRLPATATFPLCS